MRAVGGNVVPVGITRKHRDQQQCAVRRCKHNSRRYWWNSRTCNSSRLGKNLFSELLYPMVQSLSHQCLLIAARLAKRFTESSIILTKEGHDNL